MSSGSKPPHRHTKQSGNLKEKRYDALVSDYQMPGMDGIEFLKYLRPRCNGMPFILFTGKGGEEVAIEALNAGADFYIRKGDSPRTQFAELETKIRSAVARRQSERALRQSERAYRSLVENLTGIVFTISDDGILTYASPRISRFGYDPEDITGKDFAILVCAEDIPTVAHHFARVKQGMTSRFEFRLISKSRQSCRVCASCRPQMDPGSHRCAGPADRNPGRQKDDETVRSREYCTGTLLILPPTGCSSSIPEPVSPLSSTKRPAARPGYSREEFAGLRLHDWEVAEAPQKLRERIPDILQTGRATFGTQHRTKDGRVREVVVTARVLDDGMTKRIGAVFHDATDENEARRTLENQVCNRGVIRAGPAGAPRALTGRGRNGGQPGRNRSLGCPENEVIGKSLAEFIAKNEQSHFFLAIREWGNPAAFTQHGFPSISTITAVSWSPWRALLSAIARERRSSWLSRSPTSPYRQKRWQLCRLLPHPRKR